MAQYDEDDAFENGVMRDGARHRVPLQMRDGQAPMITDGSGDPLASHRPGWRIASGGSERHVRLRDDQRRQIEEAHAEYVDHLTNAWKPSLTRIDRGGMRAPNPMALSSFNLPWRGDARAAAKQFKREWCPVSRLHPAAHGIGAA